MIPAHRRYSSLSEFHHGLDGEPGLMYVVGGRTSTGQRRCGDCWWTILTLAG